MPPRTIQGGFETFVGSPANVSGDTEPSLVAVLPPNVYLQAMPTMQWGYVVVLQNCHPLGLLLRIHESSGSLERCFGRR